MVRRTFRLPLGPRVLQHGEALTSPYFLLKFQANTRNHHRFGAVISVRAGKTAVIRHIIKREFLRVATTWPQKPGQGYDFLFIASPRLGSIQKQEVSKLLKTELASITNKLIPHLST